MVTLLDYTLHCFILFSYCTASIKIKEFITEQTLQPFHLTVSYVVLKCLL